MTHSDSFHEFVTDDGDHVQVTNSVTGNFAGLQAGTVTGGIQITDNGDDTEVWVNGQRIH
ncbi:MAG: hypothetical protein ACRDTG_14180 [Pseudonocardiaceae bacterium]